MKTRKRANQMNEGFIWAAGNPPETAEMQPTALECRNRSKSGRCQCGLDIDQCGLDFDQDVDSESEDNQMDAGESIG